MSEQSLNREQSSYEKEPFTVNRLARRRADALTGRRDIGACLRGRRPCLWYNGLRSGYEVQV